MAEQNMEMLYRKKHADAGHY